MVRLSVVRFFVGLLMVAMSFLSVVGCSNSECKFDADCDGDAFCRDGKCSTTLSSSCEKNSDCDPSERCIGTTCRKVVCESGQQQPCYEGPEKTRNVGDCASGKKICEKGQWTVCLGQKVPTKEVCDGKDNDCNGKVDDVEGGCKNTGGCKDGDSRPCYTGPLGTSGKGECKSGKEYCQQGQWRGCVGDTKPTKEVCGDKKDNDCDGQVDNGCGACQESSFRACYTGAPGTKGVGACKDGLQTCEKGQWGACTGEVKPSKEVCDSKDNDCNGKVDDDPSCQGECISGSSRVCYNGPPGTQNLGVCRPGTQLCQNKKWGNCNGEIRPGTEKCGDKQDNNCNGQVDEGCGVCKSGDQEVCYSGASGCRKQPDRSYVCNTPCKYGIRSCQSNGQWGPCTGEVLPAAKETCFDNIDNDCNGQVDDNCGSCQPGATRACYNGPTATRGKGVCKDGRETCVNGRWSTCSGEVRPTTEVCNDSKDNDCDGQTDEGCSSGVFAKEGESCNGKLCVSGTLCVSFGAGFPSVCLKTCSTSCSSGFSCVALQNGKKICIQSGCTSDSSCRFQNPPHVCAPPQSGVRYCVPGQLTGNLRFGARCDETQANYRCSPGLTCIKLTGATWGHCSQSCNTKACPTSPSGARCVQTSTTTSYCLFPCTSCPTGLKCNTSVNYCFP